MRFNVKKNCYKNIYNIDAKSDLKKEVLTTFSHLLRIFTAIKCFHRLKRLRRLC